MTGLGGTGRLADDLYLLAHHETTGKPHLQPRAACRGLARALLAELMLAGRIRCWRGLIIPALGGPPADDLSQQMLSLVASERERPPRDWLLYLSRTATGLMILDFFLRRRKARTEDKVEVGGTTDTSLEATTLSNDAHTRSPLRFRIFCFAIGFSFFTILIRCLYRIPEMAGGWGNPRMRDEPVFLGLDGAMVALASISFTVAHPGFLFPPMRKGSKSRS